MQYNDMNIACAALLLVLGNAAQASDPNADAYPEDCFNDAVAQQNDLEPPLPGSDADLFRITDEDVKALLVDINAAERRRANAARPRSN